MMEPADVIAFPSRNLVRSDCQDQPPGYVEFAVASNFSFLHGASHPEELVAQAAHLGLTGFGLSDRNSVAGVVRPHVSKLHNKLSLRFHPGARLVFADGTPDILAYPRDRSGWGQLCRLLTRGNGRAEKGQCILYLDDLLAFASGLELIVCERSTCGPAPAAIKSGSLFPDDPERIPLRAARGRKRPSPVQIGREPVVMRLREAFPDQVRLAATALFRGSDRVGLDALATRARELAVPLIAVNDVLYHHPDRRPLQDVLTCIREGLRIDHAGRKLGSNAERFLKPPAEMARLFSDHPDAIAETIRLSEGLTFSLAELAYEYPEETRAGFSTPQEALVHFTYEGAKQRYPNGLPPKVQASLQHELALIERVRYAPYFLTVHDIVRFARTKGILCQGRGSAANSAVCFCLGITEVDPSIHDLLFERFISVSRNEPPDIDVDFEHERREEVIQYIYGRYGRERAGIAATVISYRSRSAIREVGKVFGLSEDTITTLSSGIWGGGGENDDAPRSSSGKSAARDKDPRPLAPARSTEGDEDEAPPRQKPVLQKGMLQRVGLDPTTRRVAQIAGCVNEILGFPRHLSQHVGGFVITRSRLDEVVPIANGAMKDRTFVEWDKDDLNDLGILKIDVLGLGMLTCIRKALELLDRHYGEQRTLATIEPEDPAVYRMLQRADTIGVFQVESRAQMSMLPRLRPKTFYDLVIEVAIVRPGPIQGDMVHPYLRRRQGLEPVSFPSQELEAVLAKTLGVPLFQEQAMRIAIVAAGFTPEEADQLRRAMATFKRVGTIGTFQRKMIDGMVVKGYPREFAERCFRQIEGFGEYGFPESHAASFALLVYASAWLKCHYPDAFAAGLLNSQPMGFYAPAQIVRDVREHGVAVRPVDVNFSSWDATLEPADPDRSQLHPLHAEMESDIYTQHAIRLGLREVRGLRKEDAERLVACRDGSLDSREGQDSIRTPYRSVRDLWLRSGLPPTALERLADADAFGSLHLSRRRALWAVKGLGRSGDKDNAPLLRAGMEESRQSAPARSDEQRPGSEPEVSLPLMPLGEEVVNDYRFLKLSLRAHPSTFLRGELADRGIIRNDQLRALRNGARVRVSGLVTIRQRPGSAQGVIFMTIEDESSIANIIVWPTVFEAFRPVVLGARYVAVHGRMQHESGVIHVVADWLEDLSFLLGHLTAERELDPALSRADEVKRPQDAYRDKDKRERRRKIPDLQSSLPGIAADLDVSAHGSAHKPARPGKRRG